MENRRILVASYPRSGNTLIRSILWQCFDLKSDSVYPNDLGGNAELENFVGHVEQNDFPKKQKIRITKTHELDRYVTVPAIYIVRDGMAASISLSIFWENTITLDDIVSGKHRFGTWSAHLESWKPKSRPNTLFLRYEDIMKNPSFSINQIGDFLNVAPKSLNIPSRTVGADGKWVREKAREKCKHSAAFIKFNMKARFEYGYF